MSTLELRDLEQARRYLLHGLWLQRVMPIGPATVAPALEWALEIAARGCPLPPVGFISDIGHLVLGQDAAARASRDTTGSGAFPAGLARTYEDHVLGKIYADFHFERGADAVRGYQGRDRARGLAFLVNQMRERWGFPGVHLSPGVIKGVAELAPEEALGRGWESLSRDGLLPLLPELYQALIAASRRSADVLGPEDVFELEHGTALAELGQRVALRQLLQAADRLQTTLPRHRLSPPPGRKEVPTRVLDEDTYPVGGYASVANRGSMESLLHSQLAYMEDDDRPDLFDIKYLRDELLYYSRDENQFLRRRRTLTFALLPDLVRTRFKDAELPWQRCVLWLGLLVVAVRRLTEWLTDDALLFEFCIVDQDRPDTLAQEQELLEMVLREQVANGTVRLVRVPGIADLEDLCRRRAQRSMCHCLVVTADDGTPFRAQDTVVSRLQITGARPLLQTGDEAEQASAADEPMESWSAALERLLQVWV
jgi:hypothetical protein